MRTILTAAIALSLMTSAAFAADSAKVVLDRHVAAMKAGDLDAVMADYADNVVVIAPAGAVPGQKALTVGEKGEALNVLDGKANARKFFAVLTGKGNSAAMKSMVSTYETKGSDTTLMHWKQFPGTPKEVSGTDVWVIRDGKVITQVVLVDPTKK
jgi:ketosteroid isomerase-like protein